jgi:glycosyltransferase involved in cell wall biosynthesis
MVEKNSPLVSILMNCYNGERFLEDAINSVLAQTYQNWELIFIDNNSSDASLRIAKSFADSRIKCHKLRSHKLLYDARNDALKIAQGELVAFLDVDDMWAASKLEKQIPKFENDKVGLVYSNYVCLNEVNGGKTIKYSARLPTGDILENLIDKYVIGLVTIIARRSILISIGFNFDSRFQIIGDYDMVLKIATHSNVDCVQEPLAIYRIHGNNLSSRESKMLVKEYWLWVNGVMNSEPTRLFKHKKKMMHYGLYLELNELLKQERRGLALKLVLKMDSSVWIMKSLAKIIMSFTNRK